MKPQTLMQYIIASGITLLLITIIFAFVFPWKMISWGKFSFQPASTVTVTGEATSKEQNQKATFSAGINIVSDKKDEAVDEVNNKIAAIVDAVKSFGVTSDDIKTQNLSIYQEEETFTQAGKQKTRMGQWRVGSTVEITLREVDRAGDLAEVITKAGANNVYGPNFTLDEASDSGSVLIPEAIADARKKAETMAAASGKKLGNVLTVSEGSTLPIMQTRELIGAGGGGDMQPGTSLVRKTVTVTFELIHPFKLPMIQLK